MTTKEIIDMLIERSNMFPGELDSRSIMELSVMKQGRPRPSIEETLDNMVSSLVGASTETEHILGWQSGFKVSDDQEIIFYAIINLESDQ